MRMNGWLFDLYPDENGIVLWFIDQNGGKHRAHHPFKPSFFLHLTSNDLAKAQALGHRTPSPLTFQVTQKKELFSNESIDVLQIFVNEPTKFLSVVRFYENYFPHYSFYNSDLLVAQEFLFETNLFALGFGEYELDKAGSLINWTLHDSKESVEYELPPFSIMLLRNANDFVPPKYQTHAPA